MKMRTALCLSLAAFLVPAMLQAKESRTKSANPLMPFVENHGQISDPAIRYQARTFAGQVCVKTDGTLVYMLSGNAGERHALDSSAIMCVITEKIKGNEQKVPFGVEKASAVMSVFQGSDPSNWHSAIPAWNCVRIPGLDSVFQLDVTAHSSTIEKIFSLHPGAAPESIRMAVQGADGLSVAGDGSLVLQTKLGPVTFSAPYAWQETAQGRAPVEVAYWAEAGEYGFLLGDYDPTMTVHIDPLLASTFLGGSRWDSCKATAVDPAGCIYVTGSSGSQEFPTIPGAYNAGPIINQAAFISKFDPGLSTLLASTLLCGSGFDNPEDILLHGKGSVYITGSTSSTNFPITSHAYCQTYQGPQCDVFVSRLNTDLTTLLDSTYLGGSEYECAYALALSQEGNIICAGATGSTNFPTTVSAYQKHLNLNTDQPALDGFVTIFDDSLSYLVASTYLGGSNYDGIEDIGIDSYGYLHLTGATGGHGFPTTVGAAQTVFGGGRLDAFVTTMDGGLQQVLSSTFIGGTSNETAYAILMDGNDYLYIGGDTQSTNFPLTGNAYNHGPLRGISDAFVTRLEAGLGHVLKSTRMGGDDAETCYALARSAYGHIYAAGTTGSSNFPTTARAYKKIIESYDGYVASDGYIALLSPDLATLEASTLFGGSSFDYIYDLALDVHGKVIFAGYTESWNMPVTPGAFCMWYHEPINPGYGDGFVAKLDSQLSEHSHPFNDYNNDGLSDLAVYNPEGGYWYVESFWGQTLAWAMSWGWNGAILAPGEFNGDHCWDLSVFDGNSGGWYINSLTNGVLAWGVPWGWPGATPVTTDFDGDGVNEMTVYDNTSGLWYSMNMGGTILLWGEAWGWPGAIVVPGDYNADGGTDLAVFDSVTGNWYIKMPLGPVMVWGYTWGWPGAVPVPGDFNGDGASDFAVYDRTSGAWFIMGSNGYLLAWNMAWGWSGAQAVPGDYDGDTVSDLAVYDLATGNWYVKSIAYTPDHIIFWGRNVGFAGAVPVGGR